MKYLTSKEIAKIWNVSERSVRNYCAQGRVKGAYLEGKTWLILEDSAMPKRQIRHVIKKRNLLDVLKEEKENKISGGIYHKLQIDLTYNSNHIEGSKLTHDQTRYIFETKTIGVTDIPISIDDIVETINHFSCVDLAIELAKAKLTESLIKQFHFILKSSTTDAKKPWFKVGDYKMLPNEVGGINTTKPIDVSLKMKELLLSYNMKKNIKVEDIIEFHKKFEEIHPFQDGNGRVGRLIMFKECLKHNIVPILILDEYKMYYYRGLKEWDNEKGYLIDTCLNGQDIVKKYLDYFKIDYE